MSRRNVVITGINGFVGASLAKRQLSLGNNVIGISRNTNHKTRQSILNDCTVVVGDITDRTVMDHLIGDYEADVVFHLAANAIVKIANSDPVASYRTNVMGTVHVLDSVRRLRPQARVVVASTDKSYGDHADLPYTEDTKLNPSCSYGTSKLCTDVISQSFAKTYNLNINTVRCSNIYGPGDMNLSRLIPNSILRILRGQPPQLYSGVVNYRREFIYVDDVCNAYQLIADKGVPGEIYNIGIKQYTTIGNLVSTLCEIMQYTSGAEIIEKDFPEIPFQCMDGSKIKRLGWKDEVSLKEGLKLSVAWYESKHKELQEIARRNR